MTNSTARAVIDVGSVIADTYVIEALLGRGGMGAVFLASHRRLAGKRVAIKILHTEIEDADIVARFKREAEIAAKLNHPNIVGVIDYNVAPDGTPYLVLDYLEGETLAERIARGPMSLEHVLSIVRQVGSALAAAHRAGIVHRDLKPQNIFLVPTEVDGRHVEIAKVLDFGISKIRGSQTVKTQDSALLGTPQYMAPEQATGQHANVDERTDVFALGAIVYEMFTGRPAFSGASIPEVVFKVVYEQPAPLAQQVPTLPPAITRAVAQAMAKPSDERFPTVAGFVEAVTGQPLTLSRSAPGFGAAAAGAALAADAPSTGRRIPGGEAFAQTMGSGDHGSSPVNPLLATAAPGAAVPGAAPSAASPGTGSLGAGSLATGTAGARASGTAAALASGTASGPRTPGAPATSAPPGIAAAPTIDIPSLRGEPPARRRSTGMIAAIAFVAAAAIGGGIYAVTRTSGPASNPTASADDRNGKRPDPRANAGRPDDPTAADSKGIPANPAGDTKMGNSTSSDSTAGNTNAGDSKTGDTKAGDTKAGDTKTADAKAGDAKAGDAKAGDLKAGKPGAKPDPRLKPKNPGAGAGQPDEDVQGDDDARQKLAQAMGAIDRRDYDQAERLANAVINAPGSPRQHATARMIHGIVQCAARNDQEAANIDLRSLEKFRNLRGRLLNVCRSHGVFTTR